MRGSTASTAIKPARLMIDTPDKENAMFRARLDFRCATMIPTHRR